MKKVFVCVVLWLAMTGAVLAVDVPAVTPADFDSPAAHWLWSLMASDAIVNALLWVLSTGVAFVVGLLKWEKTKKEKVVLFVTAGVRQTYEEYVRHAKSASEDGKLSDDERREAVRQAIEYAIQYARSDGFNLLHGYAKEALPALVDAIVRKIKGEAALAKLPLQPLLPDLQP